MGGGVSFAASACNLYSNIYFCFPFLKAIMRAIPHVRI